MPMRTWLRSILTTVMVISPSTMIFSFSLRLRTSIVKPPCGWIPVLSKAYGARRAAWPVILFPVDSGERDGSQCTPRAGPAGGGAAVAENHVGPNFREKHFFGFLEDFTFTS